MRQNPDFVEQNRADLAASLQRTIIDILLAKLSLAVERTGARQVAIGGGVSANSGVRQAVAQFCAERGIRAFIPERKFTTDNAAMVAMAGYLKFMAGDLCGLDAVPFARVGV